MIIINIIVAIKIGGDGGELCGIGYIELLMGIFTAQNGRRLAISRRIEGNPDGNCSRRRCRTHGFRLAKKCVLSWEKIMTMELLCIQMAIKFILIHSMAPPQIEWASIGPC